MKKISIKIALVMVFIFVIVPVLSLMININTHQNVNNDMVSLTKEIARDSVKVLVLEGEKTTRGMLYVQNGWHDINRIELYTMPSKISVSNDTMKIVLNDKSDVYQGSIFLANLKNVLRNGVAENLKNH